MSKTLYTIIGRPIVTEKTTLQKEHGNRVVFEVHPEANKIEIRQAIQKLFKVDVLEVNTLRMPSKPKRFGKKLGRRSGWKKAVVTLAEGSAIEFFKSSGDQADEETEG